MTGRNTHKVLVTGATGFLGFRVVGALLEAGLEVTALVRPDQGEKLKPFGDTIEVCYADVWNKGSLKGRGRGHGTVIHLVGSTRANPKEGQTFHQLNLVSARNVATMAVGDGIPRMILLSTIVRPLSLPGEYVQSKRDAEEYLRTSGLDWVILRLPALYSGNSPFMSVTSLIGRIFPISLIFQNRVALPVDVAARGIAQLTAKGEEYNDRVLYARHLRKLARQSKKTRPLARPRIVTADTDDALDEPPFGWTPPKPSK